MKFILFFLFSSSIILASNAKAQTKGTFNVKLNKYVFQPGDTLKVDATYIQADKKTLPPSTLQLVVENERGNRTQLRWPVINGAVSGRLVLPDSLPRGNYTFAFALQPRFFEVVGKVNSPAKAGSINAMLLTNKGEWDTQEVSVAPDGTFTVGQWLFENNAIMSFYSSNKNDQPLDVRINTRLDSSYEPLATTVREIYFGTPVMATRIDSLGKRNQTDVSTFFSRGELLPAVIVKAKTKSRAEQFDDEYSTGLLKTMNDRIFNIFDDASAISYTSVLNYLQGRVAGLQINQNFGGGRAIWRGSPVSFFLDEIRTDAQQVNSVSMADVAIIKVYAPPFFGAAGGGSGGAIAVYTRRGGESQLLPANRSIFKISGYSPLTTVLSLK